MVMRKLPNAAGGVLSYFTRHRTAANLLLVIMIVLGLASSSQIRSQFFPDVVLDSVTVYVPWDGAGPEDVDEGIIALLEPSLLAVEGVESTSASATEGNARIRLEFEANWDMNRAADDVQLAVDQVTNLPEGADDPVVRRGAWRDRVTDVIISGPVSSDQLALFADEFSGRLFREGVTRTTIRGVNAPEIIVEATDAQLIQHGLTLAEIASAISEEAEADPAGDLGGTARVRTGVAKQSGEEIEQIVIRSNEDGSKLRVGDVATLTVTGTDATRSYFARGEKAISIRVDRAAQGDAIDMQTIVERVAQEMEAVLPEGVTVELIRTRAQAIQDRLGLLYENMALGLVLVIGLLFLFLNARTAFWVAAGIPAAMLAAIAIMYAAGLTLNMVSLFGLIITLGIVVDDAIVVGEHADFRARRLAEEPVVAAENAARRMAPPVFSATITTVIAFWGLTFVGGRFGELIEDIPFTVIAVLIASLIECFIILPNHMAHSITLGGSLKWYDVPSHYFNQGFKRFREGVFRPFMGWVLTARYPVVGFATLLLALNLALFFSGEVRFRFFSPPERASISGNVLMLDSATRADTLVMVQELERAVDKVGKDWEQKHGINPVLFSLLEVGGNTGRGLSGAGTKDADLKGSIAVELSDPDTRPSAFAFIAEVQDEVKNHPLAETVSFRGMRFGPGGDSLHVEFIGSESDVLKAAAETFKAQVATRFPDVTSVEDDLPFDKEELVLELTPQGQALGFSIDTIGRELRHRLNGITAAEFPAGVRTTEVTVRIEEAALQADYLDRAMIRAPGGTFVPLADVVTVETKQGFSTIQRENGLRILSVTGEIPEDDPDRATEITTAIETEILPQIATDYGVAFRLAGLAEQENQFLTEALYGYILCLLGIYLALTWIFASWSRPVVVMSVIPFGAIGMIFGHWIFDVPLSMFSIVGLIGMSGIIINDSIVLVTTIDEYAERRGLMPAVIEACADRLRPVLLTTLTTVLGLTPLLFETSVQAQFLKPTVITLTFGLGAGMFLVLLVVPSFLLMQQDFYRARRSATRLFSATQKRPARIFKTAGIATALGLVILWALHFGGSLDLQNVMLLSGAVVLGVTMLSYLALWRSTNS
ncbi:MAG: efflux RND transporter permease subunit [Pseudomonadota bacterium]